MDNTIRRPRWKAIWLVGGPLDGIVPRTDEEVEYVHYWSGDRWHEYCLGPGGAECIWTQSWTDPEYLRDFGDERKRLFIYNDHDDCLGLFLEEQIMVEWWVWT